MALLNVQYQSPGHAVLNWVGDGRAWNHLRGIILAQCPGMRSAQPNSLILPWSEFIQIVSEIRSLRFHYPFAIDVPIDVRDRLLRADNAIRDYESSIVKPPEDKAWLKRKIEEAGFKRPLTDFQLSNVARLCRFRVGATFSVPGSGKTTEALAFFFANRTPEEKLLVVTPKNALAAWEEQLAICIPSSQTKFVRLSGGYERISALLKEQPQLMLITYQQLVQVNVNRLIGMFLSQNPTSMFVDESHRIKAGRGAAIPDAVLDLAHLPLRKLVMSGTPLPQSNNDLVAQFSFLVPEVSVINRDPAQLIAPLFVRTTKQQLGLKDPVRNRFDLPMNTIQTELYRGMRSELYRQARGYGKNTKSNFRRLGKSIVRMMQLVSNPLLILDELNEINPVLAKAVVQEGDSPKIYFACKRAREIVNQGEKVIIWTSYVENVELVAARLLDLGSEFIHGGVSTNPDDDLVSREAKIRRFHDKSMILVANPAAASEGISLHDVCHHAIFVDRTFNAAHYLQAEDRIYRLGLDRRQSTTIDILECPDTIDEVIRQRLELKTARMAQVLNDPGLQITPDMVELDGEDFDLPVTISDEDIDAVLNSLFD